MKELNTSKMFSIRPIKDWTFELTRAAGCLVALLILFTSFNVQAQTSYTWNGGTSTDFATSTNWTPNGVPGSGDNVTIVTGSNTCVLDGNRTVDRLTINSGTLDLQSNTLTVATYSTLNSGTVEDGELFMNSGTVKFAGTTLDCKVDITANITQVYDTHFKDSVKLDETDAGGYYMRGSRFDVFTEITNSSTGYIRTANNQPDTFYAPVTFNIEAAGYITLGHGATTAHFADDVVLNNNSGNTSRGFLIGGNTNADVNFLGDVEMNVTTGSGYIKFNVGNITHSGNLTIGSTGYNSGLLTLKGYAQDTSLAIDLSTMSGSSTLDLGPNLTLEGSLTAAAQHTKILTGCHFKGGVTLPDVRTWNGAQFDGVTDITVTTGNVFTGGNSFNDTTKITYSGTSTLYTGNNAPDTALKPLTFELSAAGSITVGHGAHPNYYADDVTLTNNSGNASKRISLGGNTSATNTFNGDIELNVGATSGDIRFWLGTTHNGVLKIGSAGYNNGTLTLRNYNQTASGTIDLSTMAASADLDVLTGADITADFIYGGGGTATLTTAIFRGDATIESSSLPVTDSEFYGTTSLKKTGSTNNLNDGNIFHGYATIENASASNYLYFGNSEPDTFLTDLTLINRSSQPLWIGYSSAAQLSGNLTLDGDSAANIRLGSSSTGRKVVFNGTGNQNLNIVNGNLNVQAYRLEVNKSSGRLKVNDDVTVTHELALTDGVIKMGPSSASGQAVLTLNDGVHPTASDDSYVEGAVKKVGNDAFDFPVGRNGVYRPISISAPSSANDAFTAEYFESNSDWINSHASKETSLNNLSTNEYWTLTRDVGTSTPTVTLSWDTLTSCVADTNLNTRNIASWSAANSEWKDLGNGGTTGTADNGTVVTASGVTEFEMFTLESDSVIECECYRPELSLDSTDACLTFVPINDNEVWITLVPDTDKVVLEMWLVSDNDYGLVDSIMLYDLCGDAPIYTKGIDSVYEQYGFSLDLDSLTAYQEYKLRLKRKDTVIGDNYYHVCMLKSRGGGAACDHYPACDLVENGDFEAPNTNGTALNGLCTHFGSHINSANAAITSPLCGWVAVGGSPDIYSAACNGVDPDGPQGLPPGWFGIDQPFPPTGNGNGGGIADNVNGNSTYTSIVAYRQRVTFNTGATVHNEPNWREYVGTSLSEPLEQGVCYYYSYDAVTRSNHTSQGRFAVPGLGILFSNTAPNIPWFGNGLLNVLPVGSFLDVPTINNVVPVIPSTWTTYNGVYVPTVTGHQFITIGNYWSDNQIRNAVGVSTQTPGGLPPGTFVTPPLSNQAYDNMPIASNIQYSRVNIDNVRVIKMALDQDETMTLCGGDVLTLGCGNLQGFTYAWTFSGDPNFGAQIGNNGVVTIDPFIPEEHVGTYTVQITAPDGTTCTDQVDVISENDPILEITSCEYTCEHTMPCTLSVTVPESYSNITWNVPDGGTNQIVWTGQGTAEIIVTDWGDFYGQDVVIGVAADNDTKRVCNYKVIKGCCIREDGNGTEWPRAVNVNLSDFGTTAGTPGLTGTGVVNDPYIIDEDFTVTGDFNVDAYLEIRGCEVVLSEGAGIIVDDAVALTITDGGGSNTWLHACDDYLWKKLQVQSGGGLTIENNTVIEDAEFGTLFFGDGMLDVQDSRYRRCAFGLFIEDKTDNTTAVILGNTFEGSDVNALNHNASDRTQPICGIFALRSDIIVSDQFPGNGNTFRQMNWGIRGENSSVELISNNVFEDIRRSDPFGTYRGNAGYAIQCYSDGTSADDFVGGKDNTFHDSDNGIFTWGMHNITTAGNTYRDLDGGVNENGFGNILDGVGVRLKATRNSANISQDDFEDVEIAVSVFESDIPEQEQILIANNRITQDALSIDAFTCGIWVTGFSETDGTNIRITDHNNSNNFISNTMYGIVAMNLQNPIIDHNKITVPTGEFFTSKGVYVANCGSPEIVNNEIQLENAIYHEGINTADCPIPDIRCNDISDTYDAIYTQGSMPGATIELNEMRTSRSGYTLNNGFIIEQGNTQHYTHNEWVNHDFDFTYHTLRLGSGATGTGLNRFWVQRPPNPNSGGTDFSPEPFDAFATPNNTILLQVLTEETTDGASNTTNCTSLPMFSLPDPTVAKSIAADTLVYFGPDSVEARELARLRLYQVLKHDTLFTLDSTLNAFVDTMELTAYADLDSVMTRLTYPLDSTDQAQLLSITSKASPKDTLQSLLKEVLEIGIDHYYSGDSSWTSQHIVDLREYAALCPFKYGPGVYHARVLLMSMDTSIVFYENACEQTTVPSGRYAAPQINEARNETNKLRLYPNPSNGSVTIDCRLQEEDVAELRIFDMSGRQVYRNSNVCGVNAIELSGLADGIYHCLLTINGSKQLSEKLVILRE